MFHGASNKKNYVHKNNKIKLKNNNQNNVDAANKISNYLVACKNQTTEIIDVDNNQGIDDNNKSNVHVTEIIDVKSKNIDVEIESFNVVKNTNAIYAEMVDRKDYIHFVREVTRHIL